MQTSQDIINLIMCWYKSESLHLVDTINGNHWSINLLEIWK